MHSDTDTHKHTHRHTQRERERDVHSSPLSVSTEVQRGTSCAIHMNTCSQPSFMPVLRKANPVSLCLCLCWCASDSRLSVRVCVCVCVHIRLRISVRVLPVCVACLNLYSYIYTHTHTCGPCSKDRGQRQKEPATMSSRKNKQGSCDVTGKKMAVRLAHSGACVLFLS